MFVYIYIYIYIYIVARPRTREHAFRRTHYRIKRGSRTLPNTTAKHPPNTASTGTHPNTRSPPHRHPEHTNTSPNTRSPNTRTRTRNPNTNPNTAKLPSRLAAKPTCLQALPAGNACWHCQRALPPGIAAPGAVAQLCTTAPGAVAQICAITPGAIAQLCDRLRIADGIPCI